MNILIAASEMGSLVQANPSDHALPALANELHQLDHKVSIVLPFYRSLLRKNKIYPRSTGVRFKVAVGSQYMPCEVFETRTSEGIQVFFIGRDEFFDRTELYGMQSHGYRDNPARFAFYARCVIELARRISPLADIIQCHDWQAALIPAMVKDAGLPFKTVLSISGLEHQGNFWSHDFALTNLPSHYFSTKGLEFYGSLNFLKGGILFSHAIVLPSKRYIIESQRPEYGCGLDAIFRECSEKLHGICYGVDESTWNPKHDSLIPTSYDASDQKGKAVCSSELLSSLHLAPAPKGPIIAIIRELTTTEGFQLCLPVLERLLAEDLRIIMLGTVHPYDTALKILAHRYSSKFAYPSESDDALIHRIFAGSDILLFPTDMELSGLTMMKALKYGVVPVMQACSGFHEFVQDYDPTHKRGTGFVFYEGTSEALLDSVRRAIAIFGDKDQKTHIVIQNMMKDFSWISSAQRYESLYRALLRDSKKP